MRKVIGIGETVWDIIFREDQPSAAVPGGSTFNAMISLGRAGVPCGMVTETGDDHIGKIIVNFMKDNNVLTDYVTINKGTQSHISLAFLDANNDAQYEFYKDHKNAKLKSQNNELIINANDIVLFGSFFAINPVLRDHTRSLLLQAKTAGAIIYYDINFRKSHIADIPETMQNIIENLEFSDVVRGSTEDFGYLYGISDPEEVYDKHLKEHCKIFICTNGGKPITLITPSCKMQYEVKQVKTVSTIGAGDNFNAGFVYGMIKNDITKEKLPNAGIEIWNRLIASGQSFSANVCQSIFNYIDIEFGKTL